MKLEFKDGSHIEVLNIYGGPQLIDGVMRDTLRIEVDPTSTTMDELRTHFENNPKTSKLYTYTDSPDPTYPDPVKNEIGEGYEVFITVKQEIKKITNPPGKMLPDRTEEVYIVSIAQMTYQEYIQAHPEIHVEATPDSKE